MIIHSNFISKKWAVILAVALIPITIIHAFKNSPNATTSAQPNTKKVITNSAIFHNPPSWFSKYRAEKTMTRVEKTLEWSTRRIDVHWYKDQKKFTDAMKQKPSNILAFARRQDHSVHIGPKVTLKNFETVLAHELAHVIIFQKYKDRIPLWLEEGLANSVAENVQIDFKWLNQQKRIPLKAMSHPLSATSADEINYKYMGSLAAIEMLKERCPNFRELLNLSLKQNLETFIPTYCKIPNLDTALWEWINRKQKK
jgi:predicted SprT family Zn-dependent metalloprotease